MGIDQLFQVAVFLNVVISISIFAASMAILYRLTHDDETSPQKQPIAQWDYFPSEVVRSPEKPTPIHRRKPVVIDDQRAFDLEQDRLAKQRPRA